jgi:nucleotide-binding universal stress UspA family protein
MIIQGARKHGEDILEDGKKKVKAEEIEVEMLLLNGHTASEILKTANEGNFDLIVIGLRGLSKIKEFLVGSVSDKVVKHASCPVLVVS